MESAGLGCFMALRPLEFCEIFTIYKKEKDIYNLNTIDYNLSGWANSSIAHIFGLNQTIFPN